MFWNDPLCTDEIPPHWANAKSKFGLAMKYMCESYISEDVPITSDSDDDMPMTSDSDDDCSCHLALQCPCHTVGV